jgi:hypothetical protein
MGKHDQSRHAKFGEKGERGKVKKKFLEAKIPL